jgi:long-chain acyl-CoA synthetase
MEEEAAVALNPASIPAVLATHVTAHAGEIVLRKKDRGIWKAISWAELGARVREVTSGLTKMGFQPGDVACVLAETRPEWVYVDLGILAAAGVSGGIQPDSDAEQLGQVLRDSRCRLLFVENEEQLDKTLLIRDRCPALQRIVIIDMKGLRDFADPMCVSLASFVTSGREAAPVAIAAEQPAVLLVRGGNLQTLSHGETMSLIADARTKLPLRPNDERLALLPMSEVMERILGLYLSLEARVISNYLENPDTAVENLQELQPTVLATDARIWQILRDRIEAAAASATHLQRMLYRWAIAVAAKRGPIAWLARATVLRSVKREIGLGRLRVAYAGGARLSPESERWATGLGINIRHVDGKATQGTALDEQRYQALKEAAYGT